MGREDPWLGFKKKIRLSCVAGKTKCARVSIVRQKNHRSPKKRSYVQLGNKCQKMGQSQHRETIVFHITLI